MILRLLLVVGVHVAVALAASWLDWPGTGRSGFLFRGVLAGQLAILGVWLGLGDRSIETRLAITSCAAFGLCWVFVLRPYSSEWELLLVLARLGLLSFVFLVIREKRRLVLGRRAGSADKRLIQIGLKHLLVFTFVVALFLAFIRASKAYSGPTTDMLLIVLTLIIGLAGALVPLIAAAGALSESGVAGAIPYVLAVLVLAAAMGALAYSQTDRWQTGQQWFLASLVEATTVAVAILAARLRGYRLTAPESA